MNGIVKDFSNNEFAAPTNTEEQVTDPRERINALKEAQPEMEAIYPKNTEEEIWYLRDGQIGEGKRPEYFNHKTFKTVEAQAKAWVDSRKKITELGERLKGFGEFPEEYAIKLPDELKKFAEEEEGLGEQLIKLKVLAKDNKVSQGAFDKILEYFGGYLKTKKDNKIEAVNRYDSEQLEKIDPIKSEAVRKLKEMKVWLNQSFPDMNQESLSNSMNTAGTYEILDHIRTRMPHNQIPTDAPVTQFEHREELREQMRNPRYGKDRAYTAHVDRGYEKYFETHAKK
jgi:hypothetical protein